MAGKTSIERRRFLKGAASAAALAAAPAAIPSAAQAQENDAPVRPAAAQPTAQQIAADVGAPGGPPTWTIEHPGADFMTDVLKALSLEFVSANPGTSFGGLHESLINYGGNKMPEFLTCCHEEAAVAMAHGYAKIEGRPMMSLLHGTVGLQHASMAIYNAYGDRVPVFMIAGNWGNAIAAHNAQDLALMVRDSIKYDDEPKTLAAFADSAIKAYKIAMTPPMGPVLLVLGEELQERAMGAANLRVPRVTPTSPPQGDTGAVRETAKLLVAAERPLIMAQRAARTPNGIALLVELAETLQSPVNSTERVNFPSKHPLAGAGGAGYQPDVTLCLEVADVSGTARAARARNAKVINISSGGLYQKSNFQDAGRFADVDIDMAADAEATLPALIDACKRLITAERKTTMADRGKKIADAHRAGHARDIELAAVGWDASPVSLNRLCAELWPLIQKEDWSLVSWQGFIGNWPERLWGMDKHYQYIGGQGAGGMGYGAPAAVGAALANRKYGRLSINIQTDGDLMYSPGVLWTAAHHRIPLLTIMHNNRAYHQEVMHLQRQAGVSNRGGDRCHIGTTLTDPNISYGAMAKAFGLYGEGPISDPKDLGPAFRRAIDVVKKGEPAVIDVLTQPR
jgi:acetolactate synthase-1/2/3 large subunit